jgi:hypothetical protein
METPQPSPPIIDVPNYKGCYKPIQLDCCNLRVDRQRINNELVYTAIKNKNRGDFKKNINEKEFQRLLGELQISEKDLLEKCETDDITAKILAGRIAKNASRQGTKDEELQITTCNITSSKFNICIENLSATAYRPTKSGEVLSHEEVKKQNIPKNDCLKSFDAKISGTVNGWIFAKVVFGNGGHQDNVFEEAYVFCDWVKKYGKAEELYVLLIDTDLIPQFNELKNKYSDTANIFIGNHVDFQQMIIDRYAPPPSSSTSNNK